MPRDYASKQKCLKMSAPRRRRRHKTAQHKTLWLTTILLIFLFAGALNYLSHHKAALLSQLQKKPTPTMQATTAPQPKVAIHNVAAPTTPQFDFYNLLSQEKVRTTPSAAAAEQYLLDIKTVTDAAAADHLKAELALLGFDVTVEQQDTTSGVAYKIMVGPYATKDAALSDQKRLKENNIVSNLEKLQATAKD